MNHQVPINVSNEPQQQLSLDTSGDHSEQSKLKKSDELEMLKRYHEQQQRMRCIGCGEAEEFF